MTNRIALLLLWVGWAATLRANSEAAINDQQEAMLYWVAGDFDGAIERFTAMRQRYPDEPRGRTAMFHAANLLENKRMPLVRSTAEAREILTRAREYYRQAASTPGQASQALERSREGVARTSQKLSNIERIEAGDYDFRIASEKLSDLEASRAAVDALAQSLDNNSSLAHEIHFLMLVHQGDYIDTLSAAMTDAYGQLRESRPELFEKAFGIFTPQIEHAVTEAIEIGSAAIEKYPDSPHRADYHVYLGSAYQSAAMLHMARRDRHEQRGELEGVESERKEIVRFLREAKNQSQTIALLADERTAAGAPPAEATDWQKQKVRALVRVAEIDRLLLSFSMPQPQPPAAPPQPAEVK